MILRVLTSLWFLASFSDAIAAPLLSLGLWKRRGESGLGLYWSLALAGIAVECSILNAALLGTPQGVPMQYVLLRLIGRTVKTASLWLMALYVLGLIGKGGDGPQI